MTLTRAEILKPAEAARELGVCLKTLQRLRRAGAIRAIDVSVAAGERGAWRYHPDDIEAFQNARRRARAAEETAPCPSTGRKARPSGTTTFSSEVVDFAERLKRRIARPRGESSSSPSSA